MAFKIYSLFVLLILFLLENSEASNHRIDRWIESPRVTNWGDWKQEQLCPDNSWVSAMDLKIEPEQGRDDDTGLNGIRLSCTDLDGQHTADITSGEGSWGFYRGKRFCDDAFAAGFQLRSEPNQGLGDDAAASDMKLLCVKTNYLPSTIIGGDVLNFGSWTEQQICPQATAICGIRTQVESQQGKGDDSALNNVDFACCSIPMS